MGGGGGFLSGRRRPSTCTYVYSHAAMSPILGICGGVPNSISLNAEESDHRAPAVGRAIANAPRFSRPETKCPSEISNAQGPGTRRQYPIAWCAISRVGHFRIFLRANSPSAQFSDESGPSSLSELDAFAANRSIFKAPVTWALMYGSAPIARQCPALLIAASGDPPASRF